MAEAARQQLVEWPQYHFGYRADELQQMTTWLDQVVSELRVAAGKSSFDLALVATAPAPAVPNVDLLPAPTFRERLELGLAAARLTPEPPQRIALLRAILDVLAPTDRPEFEDSWMAELRLRAAGELAAEVRIDNAYADLRTGRWRAPPSSEARRRPRAAGRRAVGAGEDARLEGGRPADVAALLATLDVKLDAARRFGSRWTRGRCAPRSSRGTGHACASGSISFSPCASGCRMSASSPGRRRARCASCQRARGRCPARAGTVQPPPEVAAAHSTLVAAAGMAVRAATSRLDAIRSGSMDTAWQASSAAAGSLMMLDQAIAELRRITHAPQPAR